MQGFSPAADNNKSAILSILSSYLTSGDHVLEIGSGSGQHAIHMSNALPQIEWQPTDRAMTLGLLSSNIREYGAPNLHPPIEIDLKTTTHVISEGVQCVFAANVTHIVSERLCTNLIHLAAENLVKGGFLILYGPYRYSGEFTTQSNRDFDAWLKDRDSESGVRDFEWVVGLACEQGMSLMKDHIMPANNQCLVFQKDE